MHFAAGIYPYLENGQMQYIRYAKNLNYLGPGGPRVTQHCNSYNSSPLDKVAAISQTMFSFAF